VIRIFARIHELHCLLGDLHHEQRRIIKDDLNVSTRYLENGFKIVELERELSELLWQLADLKDVVPPRI
jgi:hypothetical protein